MAVPDVDAPDPLINIGPIPIPAPVSAAGQIHYRLETADRDHSIVISMDGPPTEIDPSPPEWTQLAVERCPNCPLDETTVKHCPMALHFVPVLNLCEGLHSYDNVTLTVTTPTRVVTQATSIQRALGSLMGMVSALSGCPRTAAFRPMALFHLPLATPQETLFRVVGMYLIGQLLAKRSAPTITIGDLTPLTEFYTNLDIINHAIANRLRRAMDTDAGVNAVIILDMLGKTVPYSIEDHLVDLEPFFTGWTIAAP
jgi:hypothetical protein